MFQAGEVIRKLLKWRLDIYLFQIASEEEFHSVLNKSEPEKKEKISVCTSSKNNNASHFFRGENLSQNAVSLWPLLSFPLCLIISISNVSFLFWKGSFKTRQYFIQICESKHLYLQLCKPKIDCKTGLKLSTVHMQD